MVTETETKTEGESGESKPEEAKPVDLRPQASTQKPTKVLPTNRMAFAKQLDALRAFDAASGQMRKAVPNTEVAKILQIAHQTLSLANPFFLDVGLIRKGEGGGLIPSDAVREYALAYAWDPQQAAHKLAPAFAEHWSWQTLLPQLQFKKTLSEREALGLLSQAAAAGPDYRSQLLLLLSYLDACGLVEFDGSTVRLLSSNGASASASPETPPADTPPPPSKHGNPATVSTTFTQHPEGQIQFAVSVRVDMSEFSGWRADRIAAFFSGIAQVLAAKGDVEQKATDEQ